MSTAGKRLLSSIIHEGNAQAFVKMNLEEGLFVGSEQQLYLYLRNHLLKFGKLPHPDTIHEQTGQVLVETTEPTEFYMEQVEKRHLQSRLKSMVIEVQDLLKNENPDKAFEILTNGAAALQLNKQRKHIVNAVTLSDMVYQSYMAVKAMNGAEGILFGWPGIDSMTGGVRPGDFCSFVGRPASGKTFMGLYSAMNAWDHGKTPLFVSMEMMIDVLAQRLAAMKSKKNLTKLMKGMLTTAAFKSMMTDLKKLEEREPMWMVDGNLTSTADDVAMLVRQLKPSCVWVDGAYLMRHPNPRLNRFERITENAERLKQQVATDLGVPVIASYQFSREAAKKKGKKGEKVGLEDIYGTDAVGQLSTIVMGLMEEESVETEKRRRIDIIKGRNGENGSFVINWDFNVMNFSQVEDESNTANLQFL